MNRIKDFIYNISDLVVALLIIVVVAYIISWKVGVISAYSLNTASEISTPSSQLPDPSVVDPEPEPEPDPQPEPQPEPEPEPQPEPEPEPEPEPQPDPEPAEKIKVKIPTGSLSPAIASILEEEDLIDSSSEFLKRASERKLDVKLRAGTFYIPSNASLDEVINILTGQ